MAEVFVARARKIIRRGSDDKPSDTVHSDPAASGFAPAPEPLNNPESFIPPSPSKKPESKPPQFIGNTEVQITGHHAPINNEGGSGRVLLPNRPDPMRNLRQNNLPPPPNPPSNREAQFTQGGQPIANNPNQVVHEAPTHTPAAPTPADTVTNEPAQLSSAAVAEPQSSQVFMAPSDTPPSPDASLAPGGAAVDVQNDVRIGGGGDPTKPPRQEEVHIPDTPKS